MNIIHQRLKKELAKINQSKWYNSIIELQQRFEEYPMDDYTDQPIYEFVRILQSQGLEGENVSDRLMFRVRNLTCFTYRSFSVDQNQKHIYWNPLDCSYVDFKRTYDEIVNIETEDPYPAPDIIQNWIHRHISLSANGTR